jgi:hypothetical protein
MKWKIKSQKFHEMKSDSYIFAKWSMKRKMTISRRRFEMEFNEGLFSRKVWAEINCQDHLLWLWGEIKCDCDDYLLWHHSVKQSQAFDRSKVFAKIRFRIFLNFRTFSRKKISFALFCFEDYRWHLKTIVEDFFLKNK